MVNHPHTFLLDFEHCSEGTPFVLYLPDIRTHLSSFKSAWRRSFPAANALGGGAAPSHHHHHHHHQNHHRKNIKHHHKNTITETPPKHHHKNTTPNAPQNHRRNSTKDHHKNTPKRHHHTKRSGGAILCGIVHLVLRLYNHVAPSSSHALLYCTIFAHSCLE